MKNIIIEAEPKLGNIESVDDGLVMELPINPDDDLSFKISSFDEKLKHAELINLLGKKIKITIEVVG